MSTTSTTTIREISADARRAKYRAAGLIGGSKNAENKTNLSRAGLMRSYRLGYILSADKRQTIADLIAKLPDGERAAIESRQRHYREQVSAPHEPRKRGGNSILTPAQVAEIKGLYATGNTSYPLLAERFGVSKPTIQHIITGRIWREVQPAHIA